MVKHYIFLKLNLGAAVSGQRDCGIALKSKEWNNIYEIPVGAIEEEGHDYSATYEVILRTDAHFHQPIWGLYELPPVKVISSVVSFSKNIFNYHILFT